MTPAGPNTTPLSPAGDPTTTDVERFLTARLGARIRNVVPIGHGEWSRAFSFAREDREYVVRFGSHLQDFQKDLIAARFSTRDLPVPEVIEIGEAFDAYYAVSDRAHGAYIDDVDGLQMRALLPSLFAMLNAARRVDLSGTAGYGAWNGDGNAPHATWRDALLAIAADNDRIPGWRETLAASPSVAGVFEEALARMAELAGQYPPERHLIHSDLLHLNVLVQDDRISAVLDWGNSLYGDFLYDVAWFVFWAPWFPAWREIDFAAETRRHYESIGLDVPHFEERLRCCQIHIGLDNMAYSAFTGNLSQMEEVARLTRSIVESER